MKNQEKLVYTQVVFYINLNLNLNSAAKFS